MAMHAHCGLRRENDDDVLLTLPLVSDGGTSSSQ
jgi:hypothetical protein